MTVITLTVVLMWAFVCVCVLHFMNTKSLPTLLRHVAAVALCVATVGAVFRLLLMARYWWTELMLLLAVALVVSFDVVKEARVSRKVFLWPLYAAFVLATAVVCGSIYATMDGGCLYLALVAMVLPIGSLSTALRVFDRSMRHTEAHREYLLGNGANRFEELLPSLRRAFKALSVVWMRQWSLRTPYLLVVVPLLLMLSGMGPLHSAAMTVVLMCSSLALPMVAFVLLLLWQERRNIIKKKGAGIDIFSAKVLLPLMLLVVSGSAAAQELQAKITINHSQVQGTDASVFDNLQQTLEQFVNERQWTELQFQPSERISCNFNITVTKYDPSDNRFQCTAMIQANRPVYNSAYTTTLYNNRDQHFDFDFAQFDQLNFQEETIDNQLVALFAYYAYLIIGLDLDSFGPMSGTDVLQRCMNLVNNAQNLGFPGWKSFEDDRNRFAVINDYLDESMKPFRQLQYDYYRNGLDEMAQNVERGRANITTALQNCLKKAHEEKPLSTLPQLWTDYKKDELAAIYKGKGTQKEKESVYDLLMAMNASQSQTWESIKK